jgi:hypothetical protein
MISSFRFAGPIECLSWGRADVGFSAFAVCHSGRRNPSGPLANASLGLVHHRRGISSEPPKRVAEATIMPEIVGISRFFCRNGIDLSCR